ncbi:metalloproteinase inhibitor 1-like protein [Leptotrombidium deliense]|uniref:Metalloproteinase inhibitor 1-like protein n=1 Tax=Leptotrombidium deliense TaxID=299467 RepID=A0A443SE38_9ACAR|nr:metalloproteinase inhibitor 1-like protein [Leptotrombidium deliense]
MFKLIVTFFFAIAFTRSKVFACSCMYVPTPQLLCESEFAIIATVTGEAKVHGWDKTNELSIEEVLKPKRAEAGEPRITTPRDDGMCGHHFDENKRYLITGKMQNGSYHTMTCNFVALWDHITPAKQEFYRRLLSGDNCDHVNNSESQRQVFIFSHANRRHPRFIHIIGVLLRHTAVDSAFLFKSLINPGMSIT